jgi:hypothetical protein
MIFEDETHQERIEESVIFLKRLRALAGLYGPDHCHYITQSGYTKRAIVAEFVAEKRGTAVTPALKNPVSSCLQLGAREENVLRNCDAQSA